MPDLSSEFSHFRHWLFSKPELDALRAANAEKHAKQVQDAWAEEKRLSGKPDVLPEIILPAEQTALVAYYSVMLKKFCAGKEFRFPDAVRAAAMAYFWRFYLYESVMSYSPKDVLLTSALLASKTENYQTEIKDILQIANPPDRSVIIALEFVLCQVLKFDLKVRHPFLPLHGLYLELIDYLKGDSKGDTPPAEGSTPLPSLSAAYAKAKQNADHLMSTDAQLLFTPAQLAWTCLRAGMKDTGMSEDWDGFIEKRLGVEDDGRRRLLESRMDEAAGYLKLKLELTPPEAGKLREKLAKCANPLKDPNSAVAKARKEEAAKREEERRKAKREKETTKHAALSDVFS